MTSFNHPPMILSMSLAPAPAAGNPVVIKPSEQTPITICKQFLEKFKAKLVR